MSILAGLPFIIGLIANVVGGTVVDMLPRSKAPVVCTVGGIATAVCTENLFRVDDVMESPKLAE